MSTTIEVSLSTETIQACWGSANSLSYHATGAVIHTGLESEDLDALNIIQRSARTLSASGVTSISLVGGWSTEAEFHFWQGAYQPNSMPKIDYSEANLINRETLNNYISVNTWVRDLINQTPEELSPENLAQAAIDFIQQLAPDDVSFKLICGDQLKEQGYAGLYGVGRGSDRAPVLLELDYCPAGCEDTPPLASLVGKGITFDSGGYSLKSSLGMLHMKADMGGAATVAGALALAILGGLKQRVKLYLCCAENLVSGGAYKLSDILHYRNGVSVEVVNTDAEGRLVLADGLIDASRDKPSLIIDAATLTGAAHVAVGDDYNALFCMNDDLAASFDAICKTEHDVCWRLPLSPAHRSKCPSDYADTANSRPIPGGGSGGASNAAGFLSRFVSEPEDNWLHLDLAACFMKTSTGMWSAGGTGRGVRGIAKMLLRD